jgi:hypothetical protein
MNLSTPHSLIENDAMKKCHPLRKKEVMTPELSELYSTVVLAANEGPVRIQYKCLVPIYVFPEMKLRGLNISKTEL